MDLDRQETLKTITKCHRDVRVEFIGDPLGEEELVDPLSTTRAAPGVGNNQSRDFVAVRNPATLDAFAEHVVQCRQDYADSLDEEQREKFNPIKIEGIREFRMGIVATYDPTHSGPNVLGRRTISDTGAFSAMYVVQNLWLMAIALDFGVGWVLFYQEPFLKGLFGLSG